MTTHNISSGSVGGICIDCNEPYYRHGLHGECPSPPDELQLRARELARREARRVEKIDDNA